MLQIPRKRSVNYTSAYSVAVSKGYPYIDVNGGAMADGMWFSRFTKDAERKGGAIYVAYDERRKRYVIRLEG